MNNSGRMGKKWEGNDEGGEAVQEVVGTSRVRVEARGKNGRESNNKVDDGWAKSHGSVNGTREKRGSDGKQQDGVRSARIRITESDAAFAVLSWTCG